MKLPAVLQFKAMMNVNVIAVGKLKEGYLRDGCAEYCKRLQAFCRIRVIELPEHRLPEMPSQREIDAALQAEGRAILREAKGLIIPLCIEGKEISSKELSAYLQKQAVLGVSEVSFVIGSSFGLSDTVKSAGGLRLSMSKMTFPHQLARMMLLEQIYRAFSIAAGTRYHK